MAGPCQSKTRVLPWARREGPSYLPWYDFTFFVLVPVYTFCQVKWGPVYTLYSDYNVVILYDGTFVEVNTK